MEKEYVQNNTNLTLAAYLHDWCYCICKQHNIVLGFNLNII